MDYINFLCFKACDCQDKELLKLVEGAFEMDILGIKENSCNAGLSKHYKKDPEDYTPAEKAIDDKIIIEYIPGHYQSSTPWKNGVPDLENNLMSIL